MAALESIPDDLALSQSVLLTMPIRQFLSSHSATALLLLIDTQSNSENLRDRKSLVTLFRGVQHALTSKVNIIFMLDVAQLGVRSLGL